MRQPSRTIAVCQLLIAASVAALVLGERFAPNWSARLSDISDSIVGAMTESNAVIAADSEAPVESVTVVEGNNDEEYVSEDPETGEFDEDNVAELSAAEIAHFNPPAEVTEERYGEVLERLTSSYPENPQHDIEALWALAIDLGKQAEAQVALSPYLSHSDTYIAELASTAINGLNTDTANDAAGYFESDDTAAKVAELQGLAWSSTDADERLAAVGELGGLATAESAYALEVALYQETSLAVRREALRSLGNIALMEVERERIRGVVTRLTNDPSAEIAADARDIISSLREQS